VSFTSRQPFFTKRKQRIESANGISIYGLTPESVSRFKDIRVCTEFCPDRKFYAIDLNPRYTLGFARLNLQFLDLKMADVFA
jgi:hypothetical protein